VLAVGHGEEEAEAREECVPEALLETEGLDEGGGESDPSKLFEGVAQGVGSTEAVAVWGGEALATEDREAIGESETVALPDGARVRLGAPDALVMGVPLVERDDVVDKLAKPEVAMGVGVEVAAPGEIVPGPDEEVPPPPTCRGGLPEGDLLAALGEGEERGDPEPLPRASIEEGEGPDDVEKEPVLVGEGEDPEDVEREPVVVGEGEGGEEVVTEAQTLAVGAAGESVGVTEGEWLGEGVLSSEESALGEEK